MGDVNVDHNPYYIIVAGRDMARGLSLEMSRKKGAEKKAGANKGNTETLTPAQRKERWQPHRAVS
jgi:hypothetical protein